MEMNISVQHWIKHEQRRRLLNGFYVLLAFMRVGNDSDEILQKAH